MYQRTFFEANWSKKEQAEWRGKKRLIAKHQSGHKLCPFCNCILTLHTSTQACIMMSQQTFHHFDEIVAKTPRWKKALREIVSPVPVNFLFQDILDQGRDAGRNPTLSSL